jgi:hypothetical protein
MGRGESVRAQFHVQHERNVMTTTIPASTLPAAERDELEPLDLYASVEAGTNPALRAGRHPHFCDCDPCLHGEA